ncbi:hypothetical protein M569_07277 [Genlisea aurea]|uniref:Membrane-associated kinase regulator 4 n=1 Tax=Genlisea aurea TaxID=192259 RepID=S8CJY8_9LAMI|nr:hypothetical protein M569_07277 [Genlisea aurea]
MAVNVEFGDDDYIDMELNSSSSPPQKKEFDFKTAFITRSSKKEEEALNCCPADELFYKGKLLPLLLHPRRIMVQNLLFPGERDADDYYNLSTMPPPLRSCSTAPGTRTRSTPLGSADISPSESRRVSCELVVPADDRFFRWSSELMRNNDEKKLKKQRPWLLKKFKRYTLGQKVRNSKAYLKSLFAKYAAAAAARPKGIAVDGEAEKEEDGTASKKNKPGYHPATTISSILRSHAEIHRRSFSGAVKRRPLPKPSSSSSCCSSSSSSSLSSSSSSSVNNPRGGSTERSLLLRRSNSAGEIENAIEAAIAHCKRSQQQQTIDSKSRTVS